MSSFAVVNAFETWTISCRYVWLGRCYGEAHNLASPAFGQDTAQSLAYLYKATASNVQHRIRHEPAPAAALHLGASAGAGRRCALVPIPQGGPHQRARDLSSGRLSGRRRGAVVS